MTRPSADEIYRTVALETYLSEMKKDLSEMKTGESMKQIAVVRVRLEIEVDVGSSWGGDRTVAQIYKQAEEEALGHVRGLSDRSNHPARLRVVGEPKVTAIISTREER